MKSVLVPHSQKSHANACVLCSNLGYYTSKTWDFRQLINSLVLSPSENIVFPCSWHCDPLFPNLIEELKSNGKHIKLVFLESYWSSLKQEEKEQLLGNEIALVHTGFKSINSLSNSFTNYFLVMKTKWNMATWKNLQKEKRHKLSLFFPPEHPFGSVEYTVKECFEIAGDLKRFDPDTEFSYPFGHDTVDMRNPDHLRWNLVPSWEKESPSFASASPLISIVMPFNNRSKLLLKVLHNLKQQTLDKKKYEILLIDDGSDEKEVQLLHSNLKVLNELPYKIFYLKRDIKLTALYIGNRAGPARNLGASMARGEILLFLDSDILIPHDYLNLVLEEGKKSDITLPIRVYLNKEKSDSEFILYEDVSSTDTYITPWQGYLKDFYQKGDWDKVDHPWKYFITYCLSIKKDLFIKIGGFRTNYISFGYEDLDFGFRAVKYNSRRKLIKKNVYHLYHFDDAKSEYSLNMNFRFFQLAMTSRSFLIQNMPVEAEYLKDMIRLKNIYQKLYFHLYRLLWLGRKLKSVLFLLALCMSCSTPDNSVRVLPERFILETVTKVDKEETRFVFKSAKEEFISIVRHAQVDDEEAEKFFNHLINYLKGLYVPEQEPYFGGDSYVRRCELEKQFDKNRVNREGHAFFRFEVPASKNQILGQCEYKSEDLKVRGLFLYCENKKVFYDIKYYYPENRHPIQLAPSLLCEKSF